MSKYAVVDGQAEERELDKRGISPSDVFGDELDDKDNYKKIHPHKDETYYVVKDDGGVKIKQSNNTIHVSFSMAKWVVTELEADSNQERTR